MSAIGKTAASAGLNLETVTIIDESWEIVDNPSDDESWEVLDSTIINESPRIDTRQFVEQTALKELQKMHRAPLRRSYLVQEMVSLEDLLAKRAQDAEKEMPDFTSFEMQREIRSVREASRREQEAMSIANLRQIDSSPDSVL